MTRLVFVCTCGKVCEIIEAEKNCTSQLLNKLILISLFTQEIQMKPNTIFILEGYWHKIHTDHLNQTQRKLFITILDSGIY